MSIFTKDPVCGQDVDPTTARHEAWNQSDYCFCSDECRNRFIVNPGRYM
jgi:YHS domain-containing protein